MVPWVGWFRSKIGKSDCMRVHDTHTQSYFAWGREIMWHRERTPGEHRKQVVWWLSGGSLRWKGERGEQRDVRDGGEQAPELRAASFLYMMGRG